jgi:hypothetical protein
VTSTPSEIAAHRSEVRLRRPQKDLKHGTNAAIYTVVSAKDCRTYQLVRMGQESRLVQFSRPTGVAAG